MATVRRSGVTIAVAAIVAWAIYGWLSPNHMRDYAAGGPYARGSREAGLCYSELVQQDVVSMDEAQVRCVKK